MISSIQYQKSVIMSEIQSTPCVFGLNIWIDIWDVPFACSSEFLFKKEDVTTAHLTSKERPALSGFNQEDLWWRKGRVTFKRICWKHLEWTEHTDIRMLEVIYAPNPLCALSSGSWNECNKKGANLMLILSLIDPQDRRCIPASG